MKFEIIRDYYKEKEYIYNKKNIELEEGLTILVGCNGSGKSTLLRQIKDLCEKQDIPYYYFDNLTEGGSAARSKASCTKMNYDLLKIAEMFLEWLTKTSKELNMNEDDLQEIIKQFLS